MRASALSLFAAGAMAAPSILKHQHRHMRRQPQDVEYKTCIETDVVTQYVTGGAPQATASHQEHHHHQQSSAAQAAGSGYVPAPAPEPSSSAAAADASSAASVESSVSNARVTSLPVAAQQYTSAPLAEPSSVPAAVASSKDTPSAPVSSAAPASYAAPASSSAAAASYSAPASSAAAPSSSVVAPASSVAASSSSAAPSSSSAPGTYPFKDIVIFGDNLSDRGNGSSDNSLAGNPETIYGFKTWTDGPIAAEQLADNMKLTIKYDFAYGHSDGGSKFGATIDDLITKSDAGVPSVKAQIANYTSSGFYHKDTCGQSLHFVWGGNNDVIPWETDPQPHPNPGMDSSNAANAKFCTDLANAITTQVKTLTDAGAEHVFVPNVYNRHVAPVVQRYFSNDTTWVSNYGEIIQKVNSNLKTNLASLAQSSGKKITYYDAFAFLMDTYTAAEQSGANGINMMKPGQNICDGAFIDPVPGVKSLAYCAQGHGSQFYWMQYLDMTAHVHGLLAQDMQKAIAAAYA